MTGEFTLTIDVWVRFEVKDVRPIRTIDWNYMYRDMWA